MDNLFSSAIILCKLPCWQYFSLSHFESVPRIILTRFWFSGSNLKEESSWNCLHIHLNFSWEKHLFQVKYKEHLKGKWYLSHLPVDIYIFFHCQKKIIRTCQLSTHPQPFHLRMQILESEPNLRPIRNIDEFDSRGLST